MKKIKILALILTILMVLPLALAGCSGGTAETGSKQGNAGTNPAEDYTADIKDLHGHEFWFLARDAGKYAHLAVNEIYSEEMGVDKIGDAVYKRNSELESTYNCTIHQELNEKPATAVKEQLLAGEYQFDYIYTSVSSLRPLSASNLLVDFKELDQVDLEKAWWDQNAIEGLSIAGKAFYVTGALGTMDERASWIMYFNKDIIEKARLESPYTLVREGKWTIDKMYEYMMATKQDLDGDGIYTIGKDLFGYIGEPLNNWMHVAACNCHLSRITSSGEIEIPATVNDEILTAWAALRPVLTSEYRDVADSGSRFRAGKGAFYSCLSGSILNMSKNETLNFGVIPLPKLNEEQEEYWTSINSSWCLGFAIPVTTDQAPDAESNGFTSGREQAAYFLEAMAYKSMGTLEPAFYEQVIKHQVIKDEDSMEMMDIALKNKVYDPVVIFNFGKIGTSLFSDAGSNGGVTAGVGTPTAGSDVNYDTLVSLYESRLNAARKALRNYVNYITNDEEE